MAGIGQFRGMHVLPRKWPARPMAHPPLLKAILSARDGPGLGLESSGYLGSKKYRRPSAAF